MNKTIYFSGEDFQTMQNGFSSLNGVIHTSIGFSNGTTAFPTYEDVLKDTTGHALTIKVIFDEEVISIHELVECYFSLLNENENKPNYLRNGIYYNDLLDGVEIELAIVDLSRGKKVVASKLCNFFPTTLN